MVSDSFGDAALTDGLAGQEFLAVFRPFQLSLTVSFRICRRCDLRSLEWHGLFTAHRRIFQSAFRAQKRGRNLMLLAEANGAPIGQVWIAFQNEGGEQVAFLWALRVIPWLRGLGLGSRLVRVAEQIARSRRCARLELGVEKPNRRARKLYERMGFAVVGQIQDEYHYTTPSGRRAKMKLDEYLMRKPLAKLRRSASLQTPPTRQPEHRWPAVETQVRLLPGMRGGPGKSMTTKASGRNRSNRTRRPATI